MGFSLSKQRLRYPDPCPSVIMAKFEDLPNKILGRIICILGVEGGPYGDSEATSALLCLCRTSKRLFELVQPEIYRAVRFDDAFAVSGFFRGSGLSKVPAGTPRKIFIAPGGEDSFACLAMDWDDSDAEDEKDEKAGESKQDGLQEAEEEKQEDEDEDEDEDEEQPRNAKSKKPVQRESDADRKKRRENEEARFVERLSKHCTGVLYLEIFLDWQTSTMEDNQPKYYIPLMRAINPKSILYDTGFSPTDMMLCERGTSKILFSTLVNAFSSYTRLTHLRMANVDFDTVDKAQLDILCRLPLEYVRFDWPSSLTVTKIYSVLDALPKLRKHGLVISSHTARLGLEMGHDFGANGITTTKLHFKQKNTGLSLSAIETHLKKKKRGGLMEKLLWLGPGRADELEWESYQGDKFYAMVRKELMEA